MVSRHIVRDCLFWVKNLLVLVEREESRPWYTGSIFYSALIMNTLIFTYTLHKYTRRRYLQETPLLIWKLRFENVSLQRPSPDGPNLRVESFERQSENGCEQHIDAQTKRGNEGGKSPADSISGNIEIWWFIIYKSI